MEPYNSLFSYYLQLMGVKSLNNIYGVETFLIQAFLYHQNQSIKCAIQIPKQLHHFMIGKISSTKSLKFTRDNTRTILCILNTLIAKSLEAIEVALKIIDTRFFQRGNTLIHLLKFILLSTSSKNQPKQIAPQRDDCR